LLSLSIERPLAENGLAFRSMCKIPTNHEAVPVRRCDQEFAHAMRLVFRRLLYQRAVRDEFFME
jgi:hypothetical protein